MTAGLRRSAGMSAGNLVACTQFVASCAFVGLTAQDPDRTRRPRQGRGEGVHGTICGSVAKSRRRVGFQAGERGCDGSSGGGGQERQRPRRRRMRVSRRREGEMTRGKWPPRRQQRRVGRRKVRQLRKASQNKDPLHLILGKPMLRPMPLQCRPRCPPRKRRSPSPHIMGRRRRRRHCSRCCNETSSATSTT